MNFTELLAKHLAEGGVNVYDIERAATAAQVELIEKRVPEAVEALRRGRRQAMPPREAQDYPRAVRAR